MQSAATPTRKAMFRAFNPFALTGLARDAHAPSGPNTRTRRKTPDMETGPMPWPRVQRDGCGVDPGALVGHVKELPCQGQNKRTKL